MADQATHLGRLSDAPIRAVDNGDGTYSLAVVSMGDDAGTGLQIVSLLTDIKAELVTLNASVGTNVDIL